MELNKLKVGGFKVIAVEMYPSEKSYPEGKGMKSPWGSVQHAYLIAPGVTWVSTAGHGGLMVASSAAQKYLSPKARHLSEKWSTYYCFEEDAQWAIAFYENENWAEIMHKVAKHGIDDKPTTKSYMEQQIRRWSPEYFEDFEVVEPVQFKDLRIKDILFLNTSEGLVPYEIIVKEGSKLKLQASDMRGGRTYGLSKLNYSRMVRKIVRDNKVIFEAKES